MEKPKRRGLRILFIVLSVIALAVVIVSARIDLLRKDPLSAFQTPTPAVIPANTPHIQDAASTRAPIISFAPAPSPTPPLEQILGTSTINIVLMGLDSDTEREEAGRGWRSDMIAVLVIDVNTSKCTVLNVPRDTRAQVRNVSANGKVTNRQYNKINSAFQFGGGPDKSGHENLIFSLEKLLFDGLQSDVSLLYYASINMDNIAQFADAVDGIPLTLPYDVPNFGKKGEQIVLRGIEARKFVRLRHGITGGSDIGRVERQQEFIKAFAKRVQALGAKKMVPLLWDMLSSDVHTNLNLEQIIVLADILNNMDLDNAEFIMLPGSCKTISGRSYYVPNTTKIKALAMQLWGTEQIGPSTAVSAFNALKTD